VAAGDGLRRPLNAPAAQPPAYGTQPGAQSLVVLARFVIVGGGGGVFIYNGSPGPGNPPIEWMGFGLTDPFGNALPQQVGASSFFLSGVMEMLATTTPGAAPANGILVAVDSSDNLNYVNGNDGGTYRAGRITNFGNGGQLVNSVTPALITGTTVPVAAGNRYHLTGRVNFTGTGAVGGAVFGFANATSVTVAGGATLSHADGDAFFLTPGTGVLPGLSLYSGSLAISGSGTMTGALQAWKFDVEVVVSGGTVFGLTAQEGNAGNSFTVNSAYIRSETF